MIFAMNTLKMVFFNSFDCFFHKEVGRAHKTETKDGVQYTNEKLPLAGDIIMYTPEDLLMN